MIKGVTQNEEKIIKNILLEYPCEFYYYGSRVKGDYTKGSDLDILIKNNENITQKVLNELDTKFNESRLPYKVNFSVYTNMAEDFYKLIEKDLVKIIL